jgi:hypothetical protein
VLIWLIVQVLAALPFVVLPFILQARESLHPPMNTPSLGTFGIVMSAALYYIVVGLINGVLVGGRMGWPWYGTAALALAAATIGAVASYYLLYAMAVKGGTALTIIGGLGLAVLVAANILGPRLA